MWWRRWGRLVEEMLLLLRNGGYKGVVWLALGRRVVVAGAAEGPRR